MSITVIDHSGRVLPFEQFRAEVHDSCAVGGVPVPHLHTLNRGPAIAIDRTPVPDPAPQGCGFGAIQGPASSASVVRLANVSPAEVRAWSTLTGIPLTTSAAVPPDGESRAPAAATPDVTVERDAPTVSNTSVWSMLVVPLLLLAGVAGGYLLANRGAKSAAAPSRNTPRVGDYEPSDGDGVLRERLTRGHAALLALPVEAPALPAAETEDVEVQPDAASGDGAVATSTTRPPEDEDARG